MEHPGRKYITIVIFLALATYGFSQDISLISKAKPLTVNGSFQGGVNYLESANTNIPPLGYYTSLQLQFSLYSYIQIPVTFSYGNYGSSINTLSFTRFGISPSYKSLKIHGGYRSYQLSPYLMSGMTVLGGGLEYTPRKFYFMGFAGKIVDRYNLGGDFLQFQDENIQFYNRNTYGVKIGIGKSTHRFSLMAFHSRDDQTSGSLDSLQKYNITPKENFILGGELYQQFFKILTFHFNGAASIMTNDIEGNEIETNETGEKWLKRTSFLTSINETSRYAFAYDGKISLRIKSINIGIKYQHIDPFYTSFGVAFMQSNFDNYLIDIQGSLFKNKCILFTNFGLQYVHKNGVTGQPQKRIVQNTNVSWTFNKSLSLQLGYNNFSQNTEPKVEDVNDSLRLTTNSQGWNVAWNIRPGRTKEKPHVINLSVSQNIFDLIQNDNTLATNQTLNGNLGYRYVIKNKWNLSAALNYNDFTIGDGRDATRYGLVLGYGKNLSEKINIKLQGSYKLNLTDNQSDGNVINAGLNLQWKLTKSHNLYVNTSALWRRTVLQIPKDEYRWRANYSYSF